MSIKHDHTLHPITALAFHGDESGSLFLLAGEGPFLKVFEARTSKLIHQGQIFEGQTIHGIAVQDDVSDDDGLQIIIWGGSSLVMLTKRTFEGLLSDRSSTITGVFCSASDWILDAAISPQNTRCCVLVTAHNTVLRARFEENHTSISIEELHSPSRSILYSAHLIWDFPDAILVAAGTVFGEIIAWKCVIPEDATQSEGKVLFTFTGHEGSIFGVNISPPITRPDKSVGRLLASCSDDRTIRVWDLSSEQSKDHEGQQSSAIRETGFGDNGQSTEDNCVAVAMGHASRIWRVKFLLNTVQAVESVNILSFGEDSTTQQWSLAFNPPSRVLKEERLSSPPATQLSGDLRHRQLSAFHSGKHIWSTAIYHRVNNESLLATGGADGKIAMYPVNNSDESQLFPIDKNDLDQSTSQPKLLWQFGTSWELAEILATFSQTQSTAQKQPFSEEQTREAREGEVSAESTPKKKKANKVPKDAFNRYAFASERQAVVTTTLGRILTIDTEDTSTWKELSLPEHTKHELKSWSVIKGFPEARLVFLAGTSGRIYAYHGELHLAEIGKVEGKVADMFVVSNSTTGKSDLLVTNLFASQVTIFAIEPTSKQPLLSAPFFYELPLNFIVTSAGSTGKHLVLGSRYGSLAVYDSEGILIDIGDFDKSLSGDAVTAIVPLPGARVNEEQLYFLTTGRKGVYSIFALTSPSGPEAVPTLSLLHQGSPPFGPMIEHAWYTSNQDLLLYGFKGKNFIVWNETQQYEIMNVECGGAHRSYAFLPSYQGGHFIYTKASRSYLHSQPASSHQIVKSGGHGREIKSCSILAEERLIATGAEDTTIRIWSYSSSSSTLENHFRCLAVVQKHTAGIQHLQWSKSTYLFSSGGNEEFFIWAVSPLPNGGIGVMCEATCPDQSEQRDLRIMGFDATEIRSTEGEETRLLVSLAYSDSTLRVYTYSKSKGYGFVAKGRYTSSCLMQIKNLAIEDEAFTILTAATDGNLTIWSGHITSGQEQELIMLSTKKVHQSSVKSMDVSTSHRGNHIFVATGGDDNALGITVYEKSQLLASSEQQPRIFVLRSAHAAAITGLTFILSTEAIPSSGAKDKFRIVTSSNDQRVKEWQVVLSTETLDLQIRNGGDVFTSVADVGDVAFWKDMEDGDGGKVFVVGNGIEVWNVGGSR